LGGDFMSTWRRGSRREEFLARVVLLVNLAGAAWLSAQFLRGRTRLHRLERWQTSYLPVFALWAGAVVVVLPLVFTFD
jgi:hypothetical protein